MRQIIQLDRTEFNAEMDGRTGEERWWDGERPSGPKGGVSIDLEVLCGCVEGLTDSVALLFSVFGATQQFVEAFLARHLWNNNTSPTQEDKDPRFNGFFL